MAYRVIGSTSFSQIPDAAWRVSRRLNASYCVNHLFLRLQADSSGGFSSESGLMVIELASRSGFDVGSLLSGSSS